MKRHLFIILFLFACNNDPFERSNQYIEDSNKRIKEAKEARKECEKDERDCKRDCREELELTNNTALYYKCQEYCLENSIICLDEAKRLL